MEARDRLLRRSSWLPLLALLARLGTLPRLTGGRPVVCMGVFMFLGVRPSSCCPHAACRPARYAHFARWAAPHARLRHQREGSGSAADAPSPRGLLLFDSVRRRHRRLRTNQDYMHIYTTSRTSDRRAQRGLRAAACEFQHRATCPMNLAPLWPEAAAPRRHLPRRDRELRVEEALLLQFGGDARRRVRRELQARDGGRYAQ